MPFYRLLPAILSCLLFVGCSDLECPRDMVRTGKICRRCEPGFGTAGGVCRPLDAGAELDAGIVAELDAGTPSEDADTVAAPDTNAACAPVPEQCGNASDDDCDGNIDEASGAGELCNGADDDCDGLADEGVIENLANYVLWPHQLESPNLSQVRLLSNGGAAGWLLYRPAYVRNLQDEARRSINIVSLGADGRKIGNAGAAEEKTADTTRFVADGDGRWVALFVRKIPASSSDSSQTLHVQLFTAETMAFVGEVRIDFRQDRNYGTFLAPLAVSVFEDGLGAAHVLVAYEADTQAAGVWGTALQVAYVRHAPSGLWSEPRIYKLFDSPAGAASVAITRVPCHEEWIVATAAPHIIGSGRLNRYAPDPSRNRELVVLPTTTRIDGLSAHTNGCASGSELVLAHSGADGKTILSRWTDDDLSGDAAANDEQVALGGQLFGAALLHWGGSWFAAGAGTDSAFTVVRATFGPAPTVAFIRTLGSPGPNPGALNGDTGFGPRGPDFSRVADLLRLGGTIHAVAANGFVLSNLTALLRAQSPSPDEAAAITFDLGCP